MNQPIQTKPRIQALLDAATKYQKLNLNELEVDALLALEKKDDMEFDLIARMISTKMPDHPFVALAQGIEAIEERDNDLAEECLELAALQAVELGKSDVMSAVLDILEIFRTKNGISPPPPDFDPIAGALEL